MNKAKYDFGWQLTIQINANSDGYGILNSFGQDDFALKILCHESDSLVFRSSSCSHVGSLKALTASHSPNYCI